MLNKILQEKFCIATFLTGGVCHTQNKGLVSLLELFV